MKKLKKVCILLIIFGIVFYIYILNNNKKIYYVSLGDSLAAGQSPYGQLGYGYSDYVANYLKENNLLEFYTKDFAKSGYRTTDIINDINNNKKIKINKKHEGIKTILRNSELVTLSIGANDIFYKLGISNTNINVDDIPNIYKYMDETINDLEKLIQLIKKYCKKNIILIGYYNPVTNSELSRSLEPIFNYIKEKEAKLAKKYSLTYLDTYEIFKENPEYLPNPKDIHPSNKGYEVIATQIIDVIEKYIIR